MVVAAEAEEVVAARDLAAADSRRKLRPGRPLAQPPLGQLRQPLGPPRSLARVPRRVLVPRPVLVPLRQPLVPQRVPLLLGPAMSRLGLAPRLAR